MPDHYRAPAKVLAIGTRVQRELEQLPVPEYLNFQRELAASADISALAGLLSTIHCKLEGWPIIALPLAGDLKRIYTKAACYAVRFCSEVERQGATSRATAHGVARFDQLERDLRKPEATEDVRTDLIVTFIRECLDVQRAALMNGQALGDLERAE